MENNLNADLYKISDGVFLWKMHFNPDPNMQAQEVIFTFKVTVMQIEKALINDRLFQEYPENFAFQIFIILQ